MVPSTMDNTKSIAEVLEAYPETTRKQGSGERLFQYAHHLKEVRLKKLNLGFRYRLRFESIHD